MQEKTLQNRIDTKEQATHWLETLLADMLKWRKICEVPIPQNDNKQAIAQKRDYSTCLIKVGTLLGALNALYFTRKIDERCFTEMHQKAIQALGPTKVGKV